MKKFVAEAQRCDGIADVLNEGNGEQHGCMG